MNFNLKYFTKSQREWIEDTSALKVIQKSRQIGISHADDYHSVILASKPNAKLDVFITSRDEVQAKLSLVNCRDWARALHVGAVDLGEIVFDRGNNISAYVLQFANGRRIYSLSSNPNALAGKSGHVKIDEFALHQDQRLLYRVAKPVTTWGGTLSIISTHRGVATVFNEIIREIQENGNRMGWSLHTVPIQKAVEEGLVERINQKSGRNETREEFLARIRAECIDEEQWLQEYCCKPADESSAFLGYDVMQPCEADCMKDFDYIVRCTSPIYIGMDFARYRNLTVIDVGELIGDVMWDRMRIELQNTPYAEQEDQLYRLLALPQVRRACLDAGSWGNQLAERARLRFGWKAEAVTMTAANKEQMAYGLRAAFEDRRLRIDRDPKLRADLRGIKKEVTASGNIRLDGSCDDSHCDRFWAKALRQHALSKNQGGIGAMTW